MWTKGWGRADRPTPILILRSPAYPWQVALQQCLLPLSPAQQRSRNDQTNIPAKCRPLTIRVPDQGKLTIALITDPDPDQWKVLMLDQYLADWQNSRLTDFRTYILAMCATRFTIPSRRRVFSKYRGDKEEMLRWEMLAEEDLLPALFKKA